jgi:hypothetical protein
MEKQADDMISVEPSIIPASSSDATEIEEVAETTPTPPVESPISLLNWLLIY